MGRPRDEFFWEQVTKEENGKWKCNHCGKTFKGGVPRIKAHLGNKKGQGIALCDGSSVPINEGANTSATAMPASSDPMQVAHGINSFQAREAAHEVNDNDNNMEYSLNHYTGPIPTSQDDVVGNDNGGFVSETSQMVELIDMLTSEEGTIGRELQWLESHTGQKRKSQTEVDDWLEETGKLKARANKMIELLSSHGWSALEVEINKLIEDVHTHIERKPFVLSNQLMVHRSFRYNLEELSRLVRDDKVLLIGVHGMGGVGKTTLVTHFKNEALRKRYFEHVIWVTVSQDFSVFKLQSAIAKRIGIRLDEDDEIVERAQILSLALEKKGKVVLILDDVWNYIDL